MVLILVKKEINSFGVGQSAQKYSYVHQCFIQTQLIIHLGKHYQIPYITQYTNIKSFYFSIYISHGTKSKRDQLGSDRWSLICILALEKDWTIIESQSDCIVYYQIPRLQVLCYSRCLKPLMPWSSFSKEHLKFSTKL